ncbi:MAG: rRNA pseudouridine synthase [Aphanocapsa lilacina HA4352-LM1]|jgi:pseudouridine synthase|nr:rRNA pseudouridine synthase [Aphanocapsa lilacina HA4352-LM1]
MGAAIRLQKLLAEHGIASRRRAEALIVSGQVCVNGTVVDRLGTRVDPQIDLIEVSGKPLHCAPPLLYILLHKPVGWLSTCFDPRGRRTVLDLVPAEWRTGQGLHPVGRLDCDSSGALIVSNDGEFTFRLTHPRHQLPKTYRVWVRGRPAAAALGRWRSGVVLEGQRTLPAAVTVVGRAAEATELEIVLVEGRNRQIRKVAELLGHPVERLHRTAIGPVALAGLPLGAHRLLSASQIERLLQATGTFDL